MTAYNYCDKCQKKEPTNDLIWITAEDFTPLKGELVKKETYLQYDALCEKCYKEEVL